MDDLEASNVTFTPVRLAGQQRFDAMTPEEQDAAFGKDKAELLRQGKIMLAECVGRSGIRHGEDFITSRPLKDIPGSGATDS